MTVHQDRNKKFDCVVVGNCCADILLGPMQLNGLEVDQYVELDPVKVVTGGIVSNSGIAMARMGMRVAGLSYLGDDQWAPIVQDALTNGGVNTDYVTVLPDNTTSTTAILIDQSGEHCIAHAPGADNLVEGKLILDNLSLFQNTRMVLIGYYGLLHSLMNDLPEILPALRDAGCQVALDAAATGGTMQPLDRILPHLDIYVPSLTEGIAQTGQTDPKKIVECYRDVGAVGIVGVKLGSKGALLSSEPGKTSHIPVAIPPGPVVETIGAGDSFYAGLLTGLLHGMNVEDAGRLAAAAGACCVTARGASTGIRDFRQTARIAGLE